MTSNGLASGRFKADQKRSFTQHFVKLWNCLSQEVQDAKYLPRFRKHKEKFRGENFHQDKDIKCGLSSCWAANCWKPLPCSSNSPTSIHFWYCWRPAFHSWTFVWLRTATVGSAKEQKAPELCRGVWSNLRPTVGPRRSKLVGSKSARDG